MEDNMSDEIKNGSSTTDGGNNQSIADKLSSAAKTLSDADAGAKVRREEERKNRLAKEKAEKDRLDSEEKQRLDEERKNQALMRKKQAELEYAENYRKKLREQKARNEALAANRRAAQRKAEEERQRREAEEAARESAMREGLAEAEKRNAESDSLVEMTSDRVKEIEKAAEELEKKRQEARSKAEAEAAEALLRSLEGSKEARGPIIVTADGIELFPGSDGYEEAAAEARRIAEAEANAALTEPTAEAETLHSEALLAAITERLAQKNEPKAEEEPAASTDKSTATDVVTPVITQDYILGISGNGAESKTDTASDSDETIDTVSSDEDDFLISIDAVTGAEDEPFDVTEEASETPVADTAEKTAAAIAADICRDQQKKPTDTAQTVREDNAAQNTPVGATYLFSTSTYDMMTKDTDFGDDYEEKKKSNSEALEKYRTSEGGIIFGEEEEKEEADPKGRRGKKNKKAKQESEYRYDAGGMFNYGQDADNSGKKNAAPIAKAATDGESKSAATAAAVATSAAVTAAQASEAAADDAKISKLLEEKTRLEEELRLAEEKNREEIAHLTEKEQQAKRAMLETEFEVKEAEYRREIDELNKKLEELERAHTQKREELESSILHYETRSSELKLTENGTKEENEREALEKQGAEDSLNTDVATLSKSELIRYLNRVDSKDRKLVSRINSTRSKYKKAKNKSKDVSAPLYDLIGLQSKLLESYITSYRHALDAQQKKYSNVYQKKIKSLTKDLNTDLRAWQELTGTECDTVSETIAADIKDGKEIAPIPTVYLPDKAEQTAKPNAKKTDEASAISDTADKLTGQAGIESLSKKDLNSFLGKQDSTERKLRSDINKLRKKQKNAKNSELAKHLKPCIDKEAELLESYLTDYRYIIAASDKKNKKKYCGKIDTLTAEYNSDLETWRALTDTPVMLFPKGAAKLIENGEEVPSTVAVNVADKTVSGATRASGKNTGTERDDLLGEAKRTSEKNEVGAMSERDLVNYLNRIDSKERKLKRAADNSRRKFKRGKGDAALVNLKDCIDTEVELLDSYVETYRCTLVTGISKYMKRYSDKLTAAIKDYNRDTKKWHDLTGTPTSTLSTKLAKDIAAGKDVESIRTVEFPDKPDEEKAAAPRRNTKAEENAERERVLREEADRERKSRPTEKKKSDEGSGKPIITKTHMKNDIRTLEDKIDYRTDRYSRSIELSEYRYGEQKKKDKRRLNEENDKLRAMKRGSHAVISARRKDNARYLEIVNTDISKIKTSSKSKTDRLTELKERIENLLIERDEINMKLDSMYAEENLKRGKRGRKSYRTKLAEYRLSEVKRAFRKQGRNYRTVSKFRVSLQEKQKVYDAMNKNIELTGYLAECRYRLKHEKPRGSARKLLISEINETNKSIKHANSDIKYGINKNGKRSARTPSPKKQMIWLVVLLLLVGAGVAIYIFRAPIWAWVMQFISPYLPFGK